MCVYVFVCVFIKLHTTAQSGPVILCVCVFIYQIAHNRAIRACHPSHYMPLAYVCVCVLMFVFFFDFVGGSGSILYRKTPQ